MAQKAWSENRPLPPLFTICTDFQSAGRGMGSNKWFSECGKNILTSIYFELSIPAARQFVFNQYFALSTRFFISQFVENVQIKWPNDIYVNGKKIAGDLTEHTLSGNQLKYTIAGIGIDINQDHFPEEIPHPTSLFLETGNIYSVEALLEQYWQILSDNLPMLEDPESLHQEYLKHLYQKDEKHAYLIKGVRTEAIIRGTDEFGRLILEDETGQSHICGYKEVVFLVD